MPVENFDEIVENLDDTIIEEVETQNENTQIFLVLPGAMANDNELSIQDEETVSLETLPPSEIPSVMQLQSVSVSSERVTPSDVNGFKSFMLETLGDYETIITDYTYSNGSYQTHSIDVQPDFVWIGSALFILVGIYSMFRLIGSLFERF